MSYPKEDRNKLFIGDWKGKGLSTEELAIKYGMTPGGVKALKQRLRLKDPTLYEKIPAGKDQKVTSTSPVTPERPGKVAPERKEASTSPSTSTKRMTFWLPGDIIREIKTRGKREKRTASDILREILGKYLKNE